MKTERRIQEFLAGLTIKSATVDDIALLLKALASQSGDLLLIENSAGTDFLRVNNSGSTWISGVLSIGPALVTNGAAKVWISPTADGTFGVVISQFSGSQTGDLLSITTAAIGVLSRFNKAGYLGLRQVAAPADADVATNEIMPWFDNTVGASKFKAKAKDSAGTVVNFEFLHKKTPIPLRPELGIAPDLSGTGNNAAELSKVVSSGTQTANTPKVTTERLKFDGATDEHWMWRFVIPHDYVGTPILHLLWGNSTTTAGNVVWKAGQVTIVASSTDIDAAVFAVNVGTATAAPTTIGHVKETTIALTATNMAAGLVCILFIGRDADHASDTLNAIDAILEDAWLEYS